MTKTPFPGDGEAMPTKSKPRHPAADLSFTRIRSTKERKGTDLFPRCWWDVQPTGDYGEECNVGRKMALEFLAYQSAPESSPCLPLIVADMPRDLSGIEVAFLEMVCVAAKAGRSRAVAVSDYWDRKGVSE